MPTDCFVLCTLTIILLPRDTCESLHYKATPAICALLRLALNECHRYPIHYNRKKTASQQKTAVSPKICSLRLTAVFFTIKIMQGKVLRCNAWYTPDMFFCGMHTVSVKTARPSYCF